MEVSGVLLIMALGLGVLVWRRIMALCVWEILVSDVSVLISDDFSH